MAITPLMPVYPRSPVRPVRGEGVYLYGEQGEKYLDFAGGIAVNILGHGHPHLTKAIQDQAATLMHVSNLYGSPQGEAFAKRLIDLTFADTVFFTNSGVEAVECAIKTARRYHYAKGNPHKHDLISFSNAFHGRTMATISATDQPKMIDGFAPLLPGFKVVEFNNLEAALAAIDENTAGFLLEPIQGEGGIRPATHEFLAGLRAACDEHDLMLVFDEVQCGVARTGSLYAYQQYGVEPDIMASAKGIGGGFPMGACLASEKAAAGMVIGTHGSTYGGNPLAMAAGQAVFDIVADEEFLAARSPEGRAAALGARADDPQPRPSVRKRPGRGPDARREDEDRQPGVRELSAHQRPADGRGGRQCDARASAADDRGRAYPRVRRDAVGGGGGI